MAVGLPSHPGWLSAHRQTEGPSNALKVSAAFLTAQGGRSLFGLLVGAQQNHTQDGIALGAWGLLLACGTQRHTLLAWGLLLAWPDARGGYGPILRCCEQHRQHMSLSAASKPQAPSPQGDAILSVILWSTSSRPKRL